MRMKLRVAVIAIVGVALLFAGCAPGPTTPPEVPAVVEPETPTVVEPETPTVVEEEVYIVKLSSYAPKINYENTEIPWAKAIEEESEGRIKFEMYPYAQLMTAKGHLDGIRQGLADCGRISTPYYVGRFPMAELYFLPFTWSMAVEGARVLEEFVKYPPIAKEFADQGVIPLMPEPSRAYLVSTTSTQVKTLDDMKGLKLRSFGTMLPEAIRLCGGIPVSLVHTEVFSGLQSGALDGDVDWASALYSKKTYEVAPYITQFPSGSFTHAVFPIVWGVSSWDKLPKDLQDVIMRVTESRYWVAEGMDAGDEQAIPELKKLTDWYVLPEDEADRFKERVAGMGEWWVEQNADKGPAQEVYDYYVGLLEKYGLR